MRHAGRATLCAASAALLHAGLALGAGTLGVAQGPADALYLNGYIYTVDAHDRVAEALAVRDGRILYVGTSAAARALAGPSTHTIELNGRMLMPGLVDGHMHPLEGGTVLMKCNLNYERLTVAQMQGPHPGVPGCHAGRWADRWLEVTSWFRGRCCRAGYR